MARVSHPGQKTFWHLRAAGRIPSRYEVVSTRLTYVHPPNFEVDTPLADWYRTHQERSPLKLENWDVFADPASTTYSAYVTRRRDDEVFVQRLLDGDDAGRLFRGEHAAALRTLYQRGVGPLRFPVHALQMTAAYVAHLMPGSRACIVTLFQSADELRRIQRLAYRLRQIELVDEPLAERARSTWQGDPAWQPLRRLCETLLVTYDVGESFVALNLVVKPVFDAVVLAHFVRIAEDLGDPVLAQLLRALQEDGSWHRDCARGLIEVLAGARAENRTVIQGWLDDWRPRARMAALALAGGQGEPGAAIQDTLDRAEQEVDSMVEVGSHG